LLFSKPCAAGNLLSDPMKPFSKKAFAYLLALLVVLWTVIPIVWMVISAFKPSNALYDPNPFKGFQPTLSHFQGLFTGANSLLEVFASRAAPGPRGHQG